MDKPLMRVLVVDDERVVTDVLARHIQGAGLEAVIAGNAHDALALADAQDFDLILLDIVLPGYSGFSALGALRRKCHGDIFVMTGDSSEEIAEDAELLGANGLIEKPVTRQTLLALIHGIESKGAARRKADEAENPDRR